MCLDVPAGVRAEDCSNLVVLPEATRWKMCAYYIGRLTVRVNVVESQYPQSCLTRFEG